MIRHPQHLREEEKRVHKECLQSGRLLPFFSSLSERDSDQKVPHYGKAIRIERIRMEYESSM